MNSVQDKINSLFDELEDSNLYKDYLRVKKQLESNKKIMDLINKIKRYQKISVNNKDDKIEKELEDMHNKLDNYPIYQSYKIIKDELEYQLKEISFSLSSYFEELLKLN